MAKLIIAQQNSNSLFDSIRHEDVGGEFWLGRELQTVLGYAEWRKFCDAIDRAKISLESNNHKAFDHIVGADKLIEVGKGAMRRILDYRLSRYGAYMVAMNGDPRKPEIAAAQSYFAVKAREAEVIIPAQNETLEILRLENENLKLKSSLVSLHGTELALLLMGHGDRIVETETIVTEVVEPITGYSAKILTADQLKRAVKERTGQNLKSMKQFTDAVRACGRDDLLVPVTRHTTNEYVKPDQLNEALAVVYGHGRQFLIGE